ncbi:MAG: SUMF1/EgtB/PvdO family nonheme iron enzyme [Pseudomonadota bacterium]
MANISISLEGIDQAIQNLNYRPDSVKYKALQSIRSYYTSDETINELFSIDTDTIIQSIWDVEDSPSKLKAKRRNFSSIKSSINADLNKLAKKKLNPENLMLTETNLFDMTEEAKSNLLSSFTDAVKTGDINLDQAASLLKAVTEFLNTYEMDLKEDSPKDIVDQIRKILSKITKDVLPDQEPETTTGLKRLAQGDFEFDDKTEEIDEDEQIEEVDEDVEIEEIEEELEFEDVEEIDDIEEIELDEDQEIEEIEIDENEDLEEIEIDEDQEIEEVDDDVEIDDVEIEEIDEDEQIEEVDELEELEIDEDQEIEEIDEDVEIEEIDEELELEDVEEIDDIEEIELDEDQEIEEIEIDEDQEIEEVDDDVEIEEIEQDEPIEEVDELEELEIDEDQEIEEIIEDEQLEEIDDDVEIEEINEDEQIEEIDELDEDELKALEEYRTKKELAEHFDDVLGEREKKYNKYTTVPEGQYTIGSKKTIKSSMELQQFNMPQVYIGIYPVTNALFEIFIEETGYVTTAEKYGYGRVYTSNFKKTANGSNWKKNAGSEDVKGACWFQPAGPGSTLHGKRNHPVVQVSVNDALAFSSWIGRRLPTEAEWEAAARTDLGYKYPWGNNPDPKALNIEHSGLSDTSEVDKYDAFANEFGIVDMLGNVMEWTSDTQVPPIKSEKTTSYSIAKGAAWNARNTATISSRALFKPGFTSNTIGFRCISEIFL